MEYIYMINPMNGILILLYFIPFLIPDTVNFCEWSPMNAFIFHCEPVIWQDLSYGTVDGSEIWDQLRFVPLFTRLYTSLQTVVGLGISEPSTLGPCQNPGSQWGFHCEAVFWQDPKFPT